MVTIAPPTQLATFAKGTIFDGIISGTYGRIGGKNIPKTNTNRIIKTKMKIPAGGHLGNKNIIAIPKFRIVKIMLPAKIRVFLPARIIVGIVQTLPTNCIPVTIMPAY